ncbi:MAG: hypothetical protein Ta2D_00340 [Rickettsiales bacterium]|nr:MAG: hypothetical protein Ta2D_00340 [Rickettsiales bacterium]
MGLLKSLIRKHLYHIYIYIYDIRRLLYKTFFSKHNFITNFVFFITFFFAIKINPVFAAADCSTFVKSNGSDGGGTPLGCGGANLCDFLPPTYTDTGAAIGGAIGCPFIGCVICPAGYLLVSPSMQYKSDGTTANSPYYFNGSVIPYCTGTTNSIFIGFCNWYKCDNAPIGYYYDKEELIPYLNATPNVADYDCSTAQCTNAPAGKFYNTKEWKDSDNCTAGGTCNNPPTGKYHPAGWANSASTCPEAECTNALPGQYYTSHGGTSQTGCTVLPCNTNTTNGKWQEGWSDSPACPLLECPATIGTFYNVPATDSTACSGILSDCSDVLGKYFATTEFNNADTCTPTDCTNKPHGEYYELGYTTNSLDPAGCKTQKCPDELGKYYNAFATSSADCSNRLDNCTNANFGEYYELGYTTNFLDSTGCKIAHCPDVSGKYYNGIANDLADCPNRLDNCGNAVAGEYYELGYNTSSTDINGCKTLKCPDATGEYYKFPAIDLADCPNRLDTCTNGVAGEYYVLGYTTNSADPTGCKIGQCPAPSPNKYYDTVASEVANCAANSKDCPSLSSDFIYTNENRPDYTDSTCYYKCSNSAFVGIDSTGNKITLNPSQCVEVINNCVAYNPLNPVECVSCDAGFILAVDTIGNIQCIADKSELDPKTKSLAEGIITNLISLQQATNLIASDGIDRALQSLNYESLITKDELKKLKDTNIKSSAINSTSNYKQYALYSAVNGGFSRYNTGSHINTISYNALMGIAFRDAFNMPNLLLSVFANWGNSSYTAFNDDITATGDTTNFGGGVLAHYKYAPNVLLDNANNYVNKYSSWLYTELSFSGGIVKNSYKPDKMYQILITGSRGEQDTSYNFQTNYMTGHIGQGYILNFNDAHDSKLDLSMKLLYGYMLPNNTIMANGDIIETGAIITNRILLATRYKRNITTNKYYPNKYFWSYTLGLGYEYELEGDTDVRITTIGNAGDLITLKIDSPSLKGSTFKLNSDINLDYNDYLTFGIGAEGFIGVRNGVEGNIAIKYMFGNVGKEVKYNNDFLLFGKLTPTQKKEKIDARILSILQERDNCNTPILTQEEKDNTEICSKNKQLCQNSIRICEMQNNRIIANKKAKIEEKNKNMTYNDLCKDNLTLCKKTISVCASSKISIKQKVKRTQELRAKLCNKPVVDIIDTKNIIDIRKSDKEVAIIEKNAITFMNMELTMDKFKFDKKNLNDSHRKYIRYIFMNSICPIRSYTLCNKDTKAEAKHEKTGFISMLRKSLREASENEVVDKNDYEDFMIIITGHGDHIGTDEANIKIGKLRALEAKAEFMKLGIPSNKIIISSFGELYPVFEDERMRDRNRRVDVWVRLKR